jgi:hypothetical protein
MFGCYFFRRGWFFLDNYSYFDHRFRQSSQWARGQQRNYQQEIKKDEEQIKQLNNPEQIENMLVKSTTWKRTAKIFTS